MACALGGSAGHPVASRAWPDGTQPSRTLTGLWPRARPIKHEPPSRARRGSIGDAHPTSTPDSCRLLLGTCVGTTSRPCASRLGVRVMPSTRLPTATRCAAAHALYRYPIRNPIGILHVRRRLRRRQSVVGDRCRRCRPSMVMMVMPPRLLSRRALSRTYLLLDRGLIVALIIQSSLEVIREHFERLAE